MPAEHPFAPVADAASHTLILGSYPSVRSREEGFYYGHPRNRFWQVLAAVYGENVPEDVPQKRALLLDHGLALWDVIASCRIEGSSDASIRDVTPVPLERITATANVRRVICNGATAGRLYVKHLQPLLPVEPLILPSTSPANAAWSLERLTAAWAAALLPPPR